MVITYPSLWVLHCSIIICFPVPLYVLDRYKIWVTQGILRCFFFYLDSPSALVVLAFHFHAFLPPKPFFLFHYLALSFTLITSSLLALILLLKSFFSLLLPYCCLRLSACTSAFPSSNLGPPNFLRC